MALKYLGQKNSKQKFEFFMQVRPNQDSKANLGMGLQDDKLFRVVRT